MAINTTQFRREVRNFKAGKVTHFSSGGREPTVFAQELDESLVQLQTMLTDLAGDRCGSDSKVFTSLALSAFCGSHSHLDEFVRRVRGEHESHVSTIEYAINPDASSPVLGMVNCKYFRDVRNALFVVVVEKLDHFNPRVRESILHGQHEIVDDRAEAIERLSSGRPISILRILPIDPDN